MTNLQQAAGFMMASRARQDLARTNSQLAEISANLRWQNLKEANEQEARNSLFEIKKSLLQLSKTQMSPAVVGKLAQITEHWFRSKRLTEADFSALADKDYFLATATLADELRDRAVRRYDEERVSDIEHYMFFCHVLNDDYAALYFLMRARDLRLADEKKHGLLGTMFYTITKDAAATEIEATGHRFRQEKLLLKFQTEKVPSPTITDWYKEQIQYKIKPFASSLECLEEMRENVLFQADVGARNGFALHGAFAQAVHEEWSLRGPMLTVGPPKVTRPLVEPPKETPATPEASKDIWLMTGETQAGPYDADQVWQLYLDGQVEAGSFFWKEGMPEWRPVEEFIEPPVSA